MSKTVITRTEPLADAERLGVQQLASAVAAVDGTAPFNESAELVVAGKRDGAFFLRHDGDELVGAAVADPREATIMLAVHPEHRRRGHGTALLESTLAAHPDFSVWAFGTLPGASAMADKLGLRPVRGLLKLGRELGDEPVGNIPEGYRITTFRPSDAEQVVAVNAAAFAHHPEQGKLTVPEFVQLTEQPWFSAEGLYLGRYADEVAGFHWTKRHDERTGEVYVLATHPDHGGKGLGRVLLQTGLAHLADIGCREVVLYVEASEEHVVALYRSVGFGQISLDTSFRR